MNPLGGDDAGSCIFAVEVRRGGAWKKMSRSNALRRVGQPVDLGTSGADWLRLIATAVGDLMCAGQAAWVDAVTR